MSPPTLELRIKHTFGPGFCLDIDLVFEARSSALFGPSGAGKSSILTAIAGLWTPDAARIVANGVVLLDTQQGIALAPRDRHVGYVPQQSWLFPLKSVRQNLAFGRPRNAKLTVDEVAVALGVEHLLDRRSRMLSGGERQRVALGRAILSEPSLLACDEPFSALDHGRRDALMRAVAEWQTELNTPLLLVSHQLDEVSTLTTDVAWLESGRVTAQGPPPET
ncbi:MAG: ATP-binding cassette domain-containing protein [Nannocystaceae bacterium]|nr:ATP-binding cassette domain-containing protein [Nannocystaceae bacterium]